MLDGWFVVDSITYDGPDLIAIELRFEQYCDGNMAALNGAIRWDASDMTAPPGPVVPVPDGLWEPPAASLPANANYLFVAAQNENFLYTQADSRFAIDGYVDGMEVDVYGDDYSGVEFRIMSSIDTMIEGYYGNLQEFPLQNPTTGGLSWSGQGFGCNRIGWWLAIDSLTYNGPDLVAAELRFGERCDGGGAALNGAIRWDVNDPTMPPGPVSPPPGGLWEPSPGVTPGTGNYIYLESDDGDYIGRGLDYLYTPEDTQITVSEEGGMLDVRTDGAENWGANFRTMNTLNQFEVGYYGDLQRFPFHNETKGGLDWSGEGRGCNSLAGWFVVDSVTYAGADLESISLRFEQHCEGRTAALRGEIYWTRD